MAWRVLLALHSCGATQHGVGVWDVESWQTAGSSFGSYGAYDPEASGEKHRYYVHKGERIHWHPDHGEEPLESQAFTVPFEKACMDACDQDNRCECAAYRQKTRSCQRWKGCRRHPESFAKDSEMSMLMKVPSSRPKYKEYRRYNTYASVGSIDIDRGHEPAVVRSYRECQDRCTVDSNCDCSVWAIDGTYRCWKRQGCKEENLVYDPVYTVFVKEAVFTTEDETTTEEVDPYIFRQEEKPPSTTTVEKYVIVPEVTSKPSSTTSEEATTKPSTTLQTTTPSTSQETVTTTKASTSTTAAATKPSSTAEAAVVRVTTLPPPAPVLTTAATTAVVAATSPVPKTAPATTTAPTVVIDVAIMVPFPAEMGAQSTMRSKQLRQSRDEAVRELNSELKENLGEEKSPPSSATAIAAASAFHVEEKQVELTQISGQVAGDSLQVLLSAKVSGSSGCSNEPETRATFLQKFAHAMETIPPERLESLRKLGSSLQQPLATVTGIKCSTEFQAAGFGAAGQFIEQVQKFAWSRHTVIILAVSLCISLLCCLCSLFGHRGYQRVTAAPDTRTVRPDAVRPPRFESRSARIERVKSRVEKYSQRALDLVMAAEPDFEDTELLYYVKILNRCRGHAKGVCGSPWGQWHSAGDCELCKRRIDRAEKGLQCTQGGHRLCWRCMTSLMNWESLASQEGQNSWTWAHKDWL